MRKRVSGDYRLHSRVKREENQRRGRFISAPFASHQNLPPGWPAGRTGL